MTAADTAQVLCPTCGKYLPRSSKFCGFDGTDLALAKTGGDVRKICNVCGRFFPGYANFCAFDRSSLEVLKGQPVNISEETVKPGQATTRETIDVTNPNYRPTGGLMPPNMAEQVLNGGQVEAYAPSSDDDEWDDSPYVALIGKTIDGKYLVQSVLGEGTTVVMTLPRARAGALDVPEAA